MQEPPWMPRTEEEYRQQVAEDAGPQPDEWIRLRQALDATEEEVARLQMVRDALQRDASAAAARIAELEEALEFYELPANYCPSHPSSGAGDWTPIMEDRGVIARRALGAAPPAAPAPGPSERRDEGE